MQGVSALRTYFMFISVYICLYLFIRSDDSEMMLEKIFFDFSDEILDFGSPRRPHNTSNGHILLVVVSLHVDE